MVAIWLCMCTAADIQSTTRSVTQHFVSTYLPGQPLQQDDVVVGAGRCQVGATVRVPVQAAARVAGGVNLQ